MTKGVIYYSHNLGDPVMLENVRNQIRKTISSDHIVSATQLPTDFGKNIVVALPPDTSPAKGAGWLNLAEKILKALEASSDDIIFFCEHDVLYHPSHFEFTPERHDLFYYNTNVWRVRKSDGFSLYCEDTRQLSGMVAFKDLLLNHFRKRYELLNDFVAKNGFDDFNKYVRAMGFEPGTHGRPERVDDFRSVNYLSKFPNIDIRHDTNVTSSRWRRDQFRNQKYTKGWTESTFDKLPGWQNLKDLAQIGK